MTIVARRFLLISGPRVRVPGDAPDIERQIVRFDVLFCYVTPKNRGLHGQCTVFARLVFSWESFAWAGIALKCVANFASSQQSQTELRLYFRVCVLQLSTCGAGFGNKKSPHNNLNLTVPSGMALVRVRKERTGRCQPS